MAGLAGGCRWQRCRLGAGPVLRNDSDEWRTRYIATALLAQQSLALPRRQGIQPALQRMGGETQLRQQKDRIGAALAAVAVTEIGPAAIQQTGLESQQVQRHVQGHGCVSVLVLLEQAHVEPLGTCIDQLGGRRVIDLRHHRSLQQGEKRLARKAQHAAILEQRDAGVARTLAQQRLLTETGAHFQFGHHLPVAADAPDDLCPTGFEEIATIAALTLAQQFISSRQLDALELAEHASNIFRRHLGEQRVLQRLLQPIRKLARHGELQQQILVALAPGQQAIQLAAVDNQQAAIVQRPYPPYPRTGRESMEAFHRTGVQAPLLAIVVLQCKRTGKQKIAGRRGAVRPEQQLSREQGLRNQLLAQLLQLAGRQRIEGRQAA